MGKSNSITLNDYGRYIAAMRYNILPILRTTLSALTASICLLTVPLVHAEEGLLESARRDLRVLIYPNSSLDVTSSYQRTGATSYVFYSDDRLETICDFYAEKTGSTPKTNKKSFCTLIFMRGEIALEHNPQKNKMVRIQVGFDAGHQDTFLKGTLEKQKPVKAQFGPEYEKKMLFALPFDDFKRIYEKYESQLSDGIKQELLVHYSTAYYNDRDNVIYLLRKGVDPNLGSLNSDQVDGAPRVLLMWTAYADLEVIKLLVEKGVDVNAARLTSTDDYKDLTPLHSVSAIPGPTGFELVRLLLENGAKVDARGNYSPHGMRLTPLMLAAGNNPETAKLLLSWGADPNAKAESGQTSLSFAADKGQEEMVKILLSKNPSTDSKDIAVVFAAGSGRNDILRIFLKAGINIGGAVIKQNGMMPLMYAVTRKHVDTVRLLIENGADVNKADKFGSTPLMIASEDDPEMVRLLLSWGADQNIKNSAGFSAISIAAEKGKEEVVKLLLSRGPDSDSKNMAIVLAADKGHNNILRVFKEAGLDIGKAIHKTTGMTSLMCAISNRHEDTVRLLLESGADLKRKDKMRRTTQDIARRGGHAGILRLLEEASANYK